MKKIIIFISLLLIVTQTIQAQKITLIGKFVDENDEPLT
jgi:hypothetical protein